MLSLGPVRRELKKTAAKWASWVHMAKRLRPYLRRRKGRLGLSFVLGLLYTAIGMTEPWTMKLILDNVLLGKPVPGFLAPLLAPVSDNPILLLNALVVVIVLLAASRGLVYYFQKLLAARVGQQVAANLRLDLYRHLQRLSFRFHDRRRTGDLIARLIGDIRYLRDIFVSMPLAMGAEIFLVVGMMTVMFLMDWSLTLLALAALPGIGILLRLYQRPMRAAIRQQREREGDIASIAHEVLGAIKVVQAFRREDFEVRRFQTQNKRSLRTGLKATRLEARFRWLAEVTVAVVTAGVIGVAARRVLSGALTPGDLLVFVAYLRAFNRPLRRVSTMAERAARGAVAGERIFRLLDREPLIKDRPGARRLKQVRGEITFDGVSLTYGRDIVALQDINLQIGAGERLAVIGPTGSGKSSLVSLVPRFYDPTAGRVLVDGRDLCEVTLASIRDHVALVFQEPILFATTVRENIRYGKPEADDDEVVAIAKRVGIHPIIETLPAGYDTVLGERGGTLSGGERQAVAIARAMIKDAPIVVLDEPTSGLDRDSAGIVIEAMERLMEGRTVLFISHQMEALQKMDRVAILEEGRLVDEGTHDHLLDRNARYRSFHREKLREVAP